MITFITQPNYLPWLGIFKAIDYSDNFVFYDDVQYERKSWQNRNRIYEKSKQLPRTLTVPVKKQPQQTLIKDIEIFDPLFYLDHLKMIRYNYPQNAYLGPTMKVLESVYAKSDTHLSALTTELIIRLATLIGLECNFTYSHDYSIGGDKHNRPLAFAQELKTTEYLTQVGTREYTDTDKFNDKKISVIFLDFEHPTYRQQGNNFISHLSIIDVLINCGPEKTKEMIQNIKLLP